MASLEAVSDWHRCLGEDQADQVRIKYNTGDRAAVAAVDRVLGFNRVRHEVARTLFDRVTPEHTLHAVAEVLREHPVLTGVDNCRGVCDLTHSANGKVRFTFDPSVHVTVEAQFAIGIVCVHALLHFPRIASHYSAETTHRLWGKIEQYINKMYA